MMKSKVPSFDGNIINIDQEKIKHIHAAINNKYISCNSSTPVINNSTQNSSKNIIEQIIEQNELQLLVYIFFPLPLDEVHVDVLLTLLIIR